MPFSIPHKHCRKRLFCRRQVFAVFLSAVAFFPPLVVAQQAPLSTGTSCKSSESDRELAASVLRPFWRSTHMDRETMLFEADGIRSVPRAKLLFIPTGNLRVTTANGATTFRKGKDYLWKRGGNVLTLPSGSSIPHLTWKQLHPRLKPSDTLTATTNGKTGLLFERMGGLFQNLQVNVSYDHAETWDGYEPHASIALAQVTAKLRAKRPVKIVILGDSISLGFGASQTFQKHPCQPAYAELVVDGL
jgi:hypothetical protein